VLLTCKRIAWEAYLDRPVGLTMRSEPGTGTPMISQVHFGELSLGLAGAQDGWLVALGITNPGLVPVMGRDFSEQRQLTFCDR
jgi:hypothetical protein